MSNAGKRVIVEREVGRSTKERLNSMLIVDWAMEEAEVRWGSVTSRDFSALCKGIKARAERDASMIMIVENSNVFRMVQIVLLNSRVSGAGELTI